MVLLMTAAVDVPGGGDEPPAVMTTAEAMAMPRPSPDRRLPYGPDALQFGELRLPDGPGPHPVAIVLHGGCWLAAYDLGYISGLAAALTDEGVANLEPFRHEEIVVSGDWAFQRYSYELTMTPKGDSDPMRIRGHGIHILRRQDGGSWKITKDVWTVVPSD